MLKLVCPISYLFFTHSLDVLQLRFYLHDNGPSSGFISDSACAQEHHNDIARGPMRRNFRGHLANHCIQGRKQLH